MFVFDTEPRTPVLRPRTFTFSSPDPSLPTGQWASKKMFKIILYLSVFHRYIFLNYILYLVINIISHQAMFLILFHITYFLFSYFLFFNYFCLIYESNACRTPLLLAPQRRSGQHIFRPLSDHRPRGCPWKVRSRGLRRFSADSCIPFRQLISLDCIVLIVGDQFVVNIFVH